MRNSTKVTCLKDCKRWFDRFVLDDWDNFKRRNATLLLETFPQLQVATDASNDQNLLTTMYIGNQTNTVQFKQEISNLTDKFCATLDKVTERSDNTIKEINKENNATITKMSDNHKEEVSELHNILSIALNQGHHSQSHRDTFKESRKVQSARKPRKKTPHWAEHASQTQKRVLLNEGVVPLGKYTKKPCTKCKNAFESRYDFCSNHRDQLDAFTKLV